MRPLLTAVALLFCAALPCLAQEAASAAKEAASAAQDAPPPIRAFDLATLEKLGRAIFLQDTETAIATDALFHAHSDADLRKEKIQGVIVDSASGAPGSDVVRFIRDNDGPEAAYDVRFVDGLPQIAAAQDRALKPEEKAQFDARALALKNIGKACSQTYDTVALPDPEGDGWLVWALAGSPDSRFYFIGGHHRFTISKDGGTLVRHDLLSRSCLTLAGPDNSQSEKLTGQFTTQLVSALPVETLVWQSLNMGLPLFVATPDYTLWGIEGGAIRNLGTPQIGPAQPSAK